MQPLDDEALSMAFPWSSKTIRSRRKALTTFCCGCGQREDTLDQPLRYCSKCQVASYCSKECQKSDWPEHKPICGTAGIPKLIKSLMANPDLLVPLGGCFILAFDLIDRARCSEPLVARLDVALEPSDIFNCAEIFLGLGGGTLASGSGSKKAGKGKNYNGMLQVNAFTPITNPKRITDSHRVVWQRERAKADAAGSRANEVVLLDIFHADGQMSMTVPMQLSPGLKDLVAEWKADGFAKPTDVDPTGKTTRDPCTIQTSIQILNAYIRADRKNKMLLRAQMRPADLQVIRDAATDPKTTPAIMLLTKISREPIYQPMYQVFVEARMAATGVAPSIPVLNLL
ncbi:hypothetical protein DFH08DRAFT_894941 [Mycena albidolilacea]|uniref:MYND-type domain-containing protein n=1 Tax=Mycena albidolilacea TaxID=1033008 RepID=A0AAD6ZAF5_9AGAR|nr:hypothetical protein DFH08DRAFT_894941 [Mycena albidolilacea]